MRMATVGRALAMGLITMLLGMSWDADAGGISCTTTYDKAFQVYRTHCRDGRQFKSQYDPAFNRYRTRELPPWKPVEPQGKAKR